MNENPNSRSTADVVHEMTEASREMFAKGEQVMSNLTDVEQRMERSLDWRSQIANHPMSALGAAFAGGLLLAMMVRPSRG